MPGGDMGGSENMGEIKLKPCPFCGGKAILVEHPLGSLWITKCTHCGTTSGVKNRREYAEMAWNKRVGQIERIRGIKRKRPKDFDKLTEEYRLK